MPPKPEKEDKKPDWFNERDNLLLIQLVQEQPALWFVKSEQYKLKMTRKREIWQQIANKLNAQREIESETRTKLQKETLLAKQVHEQWKYELKRFNIASGSAAVAPVQHRFIYYTAMEFVVQARDEHNRDTNLDVPSSSRLSTPGDGENENDGSGYDSDWSQVSVPSNSSSRPPSAPTAMQQPSRCSTPQIDATPAIPKEPKRRRHTAAEQSDDALMNVLQSITQPKPMETWALGIASQMSQLNPVNQIKAKYMFNNMMSGISLADVGTELPCSMSAHLRAKKKASIEAISDFMMNN